MKIFTSFLRQFLLIVGLMLVFSFVAWGEEATLSFEDKAQRASFSTEEQVWEQNGITFINNKASSSNNVADYANPVRLYAGSSITITAPNNITKIVAVCGSSTYATALKNSVGNEASVSGSNVTIVPTASSNIYTISSLTAQVRLKSIMVTYDADVEPEPPTEYIVTFDAGTGSCDTDELTGATVTLPTAIPNANCDGDWTFVGWSDVEIDETNVKPTLLNGEYTPTVNITLYAVYKKEETLGGETAWTLTDVGDIQPTYEVVITMTNSSGTYAMSNDKETSSAPVATEVTVSGNALSGDIADNIKWNISNSNGTLTIYPNGITTTWLYCTNTNNGVRVGGTNSNKTFTIDASSGYLKHAVTSRFLGVYNSQDWRCYTTINTNIEKQILGFYAKKSSSTITYNSNPDCLDTPSTKLAEPENLVAESITQNSFTLTWDEVENATKYLVKVGENSYETENNSYDVTGLEAGSEYSVSVVAKADGYTDSDPAQITIVTLEEILDPWITADYDNIDFEVVSLDSEAQIKFNLSGGNLSERLSLTSDNEKFTVTPVTITPDGENHNFNRTITVELNTTTEGSFSGTLTIQSTEITKTIGLKASVIASVGKYNVIFHNYSGPIKKEIEAGTKLGDMPIPMTCDDEYPTFEGWTTAVFLTDNTVAPEFVTSATIVNRKLDLYPVFSDARFEIETKAENLRDGNQIVVVAKNYDYALSTTQNENNRGQAPVTKTGDRVSFDNRVQILTLFGSNKNFALYDGNGYLYPASGDNKLNIKNEKTFWNIEIADSIASIKIDSKVILYNNSARIFSCYTTQQKDVVIYKKGQPTKFNICTPDTYINTVTFYINEAMQTTIGVYDGNSLGAYPNIIIVSPDPLRPTFEGWTTSSEKTADTRLFLTTEPIYDDMTLYPLFSDADPDADDVIVVDTWMLVTDVNDLVVGDSILIVAKEYDYTLGEIKENNLSATEITKGGNIIILDNTTAQILTLDNGSKSGTFALKLKNGDYLYAASSGSNHLKTRSDINDNASWSIDIKDSVATIKAQGSYTKNWLRYNSSSALFSCYASGQADVCIYKLYKANNENWIIVDDQNPTDITVASGEKLTITNNTNHSLNIDINTLTIKSNLDEAGEIVLDEDVVLSADNVVVEKTIDASRWFFFSLPFDCNIADDIEAFDVATGNALEYLINYSIFSYDQEVAANNKGATGSKAWVEITDANTTLKANRGYIIGYLVDEGEAKIKFKSGEAKEITTPKDVEQLDLGEYTWYTEGEVEKANGWNLIGLPYYQKMSGVLTPNFVSIPNPDGKTYTQIEYSNANISPFTSFFIQVAKDTIPAFTITAGGQNSAPMINQRLNQKYHQRAVVTLISADGGEDRTTIINNPNATTDYEIGQDLVKWIGYANIPQIYTIQGEDILAFNSLAIDNSTVIPLGVYAHREGEYTFMLDEKSVGNVQDWMLYDNETGLTTCLADNFYSIYLEKGTYEGRFELRMQQRVTTNYDSATYDIVAWSGDRTFNIYNLPVNAEIYIYDAVGRIIDIIRPNSTSFSYDFSAHGVYNIVVRTADNHIVLKSIF